ncbi:lysis protein [Proteus mirabilis]|uniref:lysis system i-spanin subunit Rz n=1 Tax=Proteus mirabilis TaxID=584 RepID=UPI00223F0B4D|nr:lysis system i-spanin subunit Rz [Proteus mirabilis]UZK74082.1 lysis protein [Proteus mirabilis]
MKHWKLYIVVVMVGIVAGGCALINAQAKRINTLTENNKELTTALEEQKDINIDYQARIERLNQLDTRHTQELVNAKNEISRLRDISERNPERVYIKAECPTSDSGTPSSLDVSRPTPVARDTEENILNLMEQIETLERQYLGLRDYYFTECKR